jgi:hypothetical protein
MSLVTPQNLKGRTIPLKGLSHEMDLAFDDMYGYWLVLGLNRGRGNFFKIFQLLNINSH